MADSSTGVASMLNFAGAADDKSRVQLLIDAIPNIDTTSSSGSTQGIPGYFDEMSPAAAMQLRVELLALKANVT